MSKHNKPKIVQKQPFRDYHLEFAPCILDADFPISIGSGRFVQRDAPITRLHLHDALEIGYCHSGSGIFVIENKVLPFRAGDLCIINNREMHLAQSARNTVSAWTFVMVDPVRLLGPQVEEPEILSMAALCGPDFNNILRGSAHAEMARQALNTIQELSDRKPGYRAAVRAGIWGIMVGLHRLPNPTRPDSMPPVSCGMERIAPALDHLARYYAQPFRVRQLADLCHVGVTHFRRLFQKATGLSPVQYLTRLRIRMAASLLESTSRKILDISLEVGYPTLSSFNRHFHSIMGDTPRKWRQNMS